MATMDIFNSDAFSMQSLSAAVRLIDYAPQMLGEMNVFEPKPVRTTAISIEKSETTLTLIQTDPRGAPISQQTRDLRDIRNFNTRRLARGDRVMASEIQDIRAEGSETELMQVQSEVSRRQAKMRNDLELTFENMRLGAVQGIVVDADGSVLDNWFTNWGVAQPSEVDFDLDNATPTAGILRKKAGDIVRATQRAAKGAWTTSTQIYGLCGDNFWDDFIKHSEVRETYLHYQAAAELRTGMAWETFRFGGITWVNYRGTDDNSTVAIPTDKVKFFPVGAPGVFEVARAPGESFDVVNTLGREVYSMLVPDRDRNMWVDVEVYSYPLFYCTRPLMLQRGKRT